MQKKIFIILSLLTVYFSASAEYVTALDSPSTADTFSNSNLPIPDLVKDMDIEELKQCVANTNKICAQISQNWENIDKCIKNSLNQQGKSCYQAFILYQKMGLLPDKIQAIDSVTVFTLNHLADGQTTFHMIDHEGALIDLIDDRNPVIGNAPEFKKLKKLYPNAGLMNVVEGKINELPQVEIPKALANKKDDDVLKLIFPQYINNYSCIACEHLAVAEISYEFSYPEGKFLHPKLLKVKWLNH